MVFAEFCTVLRCKVISPFNVIMFNSSLNKPPVTDDSPEFVSRGNRFKPLTWKTMSAEQQKMTRAVLGGRRGNMQGPYNVLLRSPEVGQNERNFMFFSFERKFLYQKEFDQSPSRLWPSHTKFRSRKIGIRFY